MFGIKVLVEKLNSLIESGTLSDLDIARAFGAIESIEKNSVNSVQSLANLPAAVSNKGRFFFVVDEAQYVVSNGTTWSRDNILKDFSEGQIWFWGSNSGTFGNNTTTNTSSPVSIVGGYTDWVQLSAGAAHNLGLRPNGTAWTWGFGSYGRLGDNTTVNKSSPVSVVGGFTDWVQVSAGTAHSLGVRSNGTAWAWGSGTTGRLGDGTIVNKSSPVSVVGGFTDWTQVSAGQQHSLGVRSNGTAWAWGNGVLGQLGNNNAIGGDRSSPVSVVGGFTDWIQVSAGNRHSLGLRANGTAWGWGNSALGMVGQNNVLPRSSPVSVVGGFTDWIQVGAGFDISFGVRANGTAWAWGCNANGRLGDNTTVTRSSPVSIVGGYTDWIQVESCTGSTTTNTPSIGLRSNGTAWAWGCNNFGQLGDNSTIARSSPTLVVGGITTFTQISVGNTRGAAIGILDSKWSE